MTLLFSIKTFQITNCKRTWVKSSTGAHPHFSFAQGSCRSPHCRRLQAFSFPMRTTSWCEKSLQSIQSGKVEMVGSKPFRQFRRIAWSLKRLRCRRPPLTMRFIRDPLGGADACVFFGSFSGGSECQRKTTLLKMPNGTTA